MSASRSMLDSLRRTSAGKATDADRKLVTLDLGTERKGFAVVELELASIGPDPDQPRKFFSTAKLEELTSDISERGLLQPIGVRPDPNSAGRYMVVFGERRYRACTSLEWKTIPCVVLDTHDAQKILEIQLVENTKRADFEVIEYAVGFSTLADMIGNVGEAASRLSITQTTASQLLAIARSDDQTKQFIAEGHTSDLRGIYELINLKRSDESAYQKITESYRAGEGQSLRTLVRQAAPQKAGSQTKAKPAPKKPQGAVQTTKRATEITLAKHPNQDFCYLLECRNSDGTNTTLILDSNLLQTLETMIERVSGD